MQEMKEQIRLLLKERDSDWIEALKKAENENEGLDLIPIVEKLSQYWIRLENILGEYELRTQAKKKGLWGRK